MDRRIVKLDSLPDSDRTRAQHEDRFLAGFDRFIFKAIGGVEIRRRRLELSCTGIHHLVNRHNLLLLSDETYLLGCHIPQVSNLSIRKAILLGFFKHRAISNMTGQLLLNFVNMEQLIQEKDINFGQLRNFIRTVTTANSL